MSIFSEEFDYQEIHCFRYLSEPTRFYYVPGPPTPQMDGNGKPAISVFQAGEKSFLQLTSQWWVNDHQQKELRAYLAHQHDDLNLNEIQLSMAPVVIHEVALNLNLQGSDPQVLGTSASSGYPPYAAAFSATLTEEQRDAVSAALAGEEDILMLSYKIALQKRVFSEASITSTFISQEIKATQHLTSTILVELERKSDISTW